LDTTGLVHPVSASEWRAWPVLAAAMVCYVCATMLLTALGVPRDRAASPA